MSMTLSSILTLSLLPAFLQNPLSWKYQAQERFYLETVVHQKEHIKAKGKITQQESVLTTLNGFFVKEASNKGTVLEQTIEKVVYKSEEAGGLGGFDSQLAKNMQGAKFTWTLDQTGKVLKLGGYELFIQRLSQGNGDLEKLARVQLPEESFHRTFQEIFGFLPESQAKSWKLNWIMPLGPLGSFKVVSQYAQEDSQKNLALISFQEKWTYLPPAKDDPIFKIKQADWKSVEAKGHYLFDPVRGRLVSLEKRCLLEGKMAVEIMGQTLAMELVLDQTTKSRVWAEKPKDK